MKKSKVCAAMTEKVRASGSEHSATEIKCITLCKFLFFPLSSLYPIATMSTCVTFLLTEAIMVGNGDLGVT